MILPRPGLSVSELVIEDDDALAAHRYTEFVARQTQHNSKEQQ